LKFERFKLFCFVF